MAVRFSDLDVVSCFIIQNNVILFTYLKETKPSKSYYSTRVHLFNCFKFDHDDDSLVFPFGLNSYCAMCASPVVLFSTIPVTLPFSMTAAEGCSSTDSRDPSSSVTISVCAPRMPFGSSLMSWPPQVFATL